MSCGHDQTPGQENLMMKTYYVSLMMMMMFFHFRDDDDVYFYFCFCFCGFVPSGGGERGVLTPLGR